MNRAGFSRRRTVLRQRARLEVWSRTLTAEESRAGAPEVKDVERLTEDRSLQDGAPERAGSP